MVKYLAIAVACSIFIFVLDLVRREKLTFGYAFAWLVVSALALVFSIFDQWLFQLAFALGFELPSNFIFFSLLGVFVFLSLFITCFLCQQHRRNDIMAQKIAILESEIQRFKESSSELSS